MGPENLFHNLGKYFFESKPFFGTFINVENEAESIILWSWDENLQLGLDAQNHLHKVERLES